MAKKENRPYVRLDIGAKELYMIEQLKEKLLIVHTSQLLRTAIQFLYKSTFKEYLQKQTGSLGIADIPVDEQRKIVKEKTGLALCGELDGKVRIDDSGVKVCDYITYNKGGSIVHTAKNIVPILELSELHISNQFKGGTKTQVLDALKIQTDEEQKQMQDVGLGEGDEEIQE